MKTLLRFLLLPPLLALAGCCANSACNCQDTLADSIYLTLKIGPANDSKAFTAAELDTVYLTRYLIRRDSAATKPPPDFIPLTGTTLRRQQQRTPLLAKKLNLAQLDSTKTNTIVLSNTSPFRPGSAVGKLSDYFYVLLIQDRSNVKNIKSYSFRIDQLMLTGQYKADGCCTCYQNTKKLVNINGQQYDATETGGAGENSVPVPILLSKP